VRTLGADRPGTRRSGTSIASSSRARDGVAALGVYSQGLREDMLVELQVGDEARYAPAFLIELARPLQFADPEESIRFLPPVELDLPHPELRAHITDGGCRCRPGGARR